MNVFQILDAEETADLMVHYAAMRIALETIANSPEPDEHVKLAQQVLQKISEQ